MNAKTRLLICDDHPLVRAGIKVTLSQEPTIEIVAEASNGREAVAETKRVRPEMVLMDMAMPELNGLQAARQMRQVAPQSEIVFLSQHRASDIINEALAIGARGYVCKSHIASDLVDAVRAAGQHETSLAVG